MVETFEYQNLALIFEKSLCLLSICLKNKIMYNNYILLIRSRRLHYHFCTLKRVYDLGNEYDKQIEGK
jgi:hypothetical protein